MVKPAKTESHDTFQHFVLDRPSVIIVVYSIRRDHKISI